MDLVPATPTGEQTHFYPPRGKLLVLAGASAFFAGVGYVMSLADAVVLAGIGWVLLVGFTAATLVMLARALRPGPTLSIDAHGIIDRTTLTPTGRLWWEEITVIRKREIGRGRGSERLLQVVLEDPEAFYARDRSPLRRLADAYRRMVKHPDVSIPGSMVARPMDVVIHELQRWRPGLQVLGLPPPLPTIREAIGRRLARPSDRHPKPPRW